MYFNKITYDDKGNVTFRPNGARAGYSFKVGNGALKIVKEPATGPTRDFSKGQYIVTYKITPSIIKNVDKTGINVFIEDTLPAGITYIPSSSSTKQDPRITSNSDGTTTLVWNLYNLSTSVAIPSFTYQASINPDTVNNTTYKSSATIYEIPDVDENGDKIFRIGNHYLNSNRTSTASVNIINLSNFSLVNTTTTPAVEKENPIKFNSIFKNNSDESITDFIYLNILPFNEDSRGSKFNGTYKLSAIAPKLMNSSGNEISNNFQILYTNDTSVQNKDATTVSFDKIEWKTFTGQEVDATAFAIKGEFASKSKLSVDFIINTKNNKAGDIYNNTSSVKTSSNSEALVSPIASSMVTYREINGRKFIDKNHNDVIDEGEKGVANSIVALLDENKNQIAYTVTDVNGYYSFQNLTGKIYYIRSEYDNVALHPVAPNVGNNHVINSSTKEETSTTVISDTIDLSSSDIAIQIKNNVNIGFAHNQHNIKMTYNFGEYEGPDSALVDYGDDYEFIVKPKEGYKITSIKLDGEVVSFETNSDNTVSYTITNVTNNHSLGIFLATIPDDEGTYTFHLENTYLSVYDNKINKINYSIRTEKGRYFWGNGLFEYRVEANEVNLKDIHGRTNIQKVTIKETLGTLNLKKDNYTVNESLDITVEKTLLAGEYTGSTTIYFGPKEIKNILNVPDIEEKTVNGLTVSIKDGLVTINGTSTQSLIDITPIMIDYLGEENYIMSITPVSGTWNTGWIGVRRYTTNTDFYIQKYYTGRYVTSSSVISKTQYGDGNNIRLFTTGTATFTNFKFYIQLEKGTIPHKYTPYK